MRDNPSCHHLERMGASCQHNTEFWEWVVGGGMVCVAVALLASRGLKVMTGTFTVHARAARADQRYTQVSHKAL